MESFTRACQFRDIEALRALFPKSYLDLVEDTARAQRARFRTISPSSQLIPTDLAFRHFLKDLAGGVDDDRLVETTASAYSLIEQGDLSNTAALVILAYEVCQFPFPTSFVISNSAYSLARADDSRATYYLSEDWELPVPNGRIPKRFVVEWFKSRDGIWFLNRMR
jgi:hypothetical protein